MKLLKIDMNGLGMFKENIVIDFFADQRVYEDNSEMLSNVFRKFYANNVVSFIGKNASGKTTTLNAIAFVIKMLNNESINNIDNRWILKNSEEVDIDTYFYTNEKGVCKLHTKIKKKIDYLYEEKYYIAEEKLWFKNETKITSKNSLFDFVNEEPAKERDNNEVFLKDDISIMMYLNKGINFPVYDLLKITNINLLLAVGEYPKELIRFLDENIDYLDYDESENKVKLKFINREEISIATTGELNHYLSSGTIKGLNIFAFSKMAFQNGGYLIIDELENHFNQEVVSTLLRFFTNSKVNSTGATIIFSTHYSELLDNFERNDCVNIVRNRGGITVDKLSNLLKRNDIKRSEAYQSDFLQGTVPTYEAYMKLKEVFLKSILTLNSPGDKK